jgi:hypothetical protein
LKSRSSVPAVNLLDCLIDASAMILQDGKRLLECCQFALRIRWVLPREAQCLHRLELMGDTTRGWATEEPCDAAMDALHRLIGTAPTFAGLQEWASQLDEIRSTEGWLFEETEETLVATLAEALGNLAAVMGEG